MTGPTHAPSSAPAAPGRAAVAATGDHDGLGRFIPDPFVLTLGLVAVVVVAGLAVSSLGPVGLARSFVAGMVVPAQLAFGFQMALVLMTGTAIAAAPPVARFLARVASWPRSGAEGAVAVGLVAMGAALLNWGLGLVVGALLAREVGRSLRARGVPVAYGVLGAAGYCSIAVWHGGLSGSAPLKVATSSSTFGDAIAVSATLGSMLNLAVTAGLVAAMALTLWRLGGRGDDGCPVPAAAGDADDDPSGGPSGGLTVGAIMVVAAGLIVALGLCVVLVGQVVDRGAAAITLDWFIGVCVGVGLVAHGRAGPVSWARAMARGASEASGVLVHFPFYFGAVAVAVDSGLVVAIAGTFAELTRALPLSTSSSAAVTTFLAAGIINLAVPSGGGQWAVQGPLIAETARVLVVDRAPLVMAFAYGDQLTNLLQPFWALPILSITGLHARDLLPWTARLMGVGLLVTTVGLCLFA